MVSARNYVDYEMKVTPEGLMQALESIAI